MQRSKRHRAAPIRQVSACVALLSRLPSWPKPDAPMSAEALRFAPVVGLVVAGLEAGAVGLLTAFGVPGLVTAALTFAVGIVATGALHEDGLADVADGFGGGGTRDRKLAIMRDSRIGTFGALALGTDLLVRVGSLAAILERQGVLSCVAALVLAGVSSRCAMLVPMAALPSARPHGLAQALGPLPRSSLLFAVGLTALVGVAVALTAPPIGSGRIVAAAGLAAASAAAVTAIARRQIGGYTGDVIGAAQQVSEAAVLICLAALPHA